MNNSNIEKKEEIQKYWYPSSPVKNQILRKYDKKIDLITNLIKLDISKNEQKLCIYSVTVEPELAKDNYSLLSKIQRSIDNELNKCFTRKFFAGNNLFASTQNPKELITIETSAENREYIVTLKFLSKMDMSLVNNFEGDNQRKKSFIEKIIKYILLSNKNAIRFGDDHTIVKINTDNVYDPDPKENDNASIYKGFFTSTQITENGLFLLVLNVNKYVNQITALQKITELREKYKKYEESEIRKIINDYFSHKTVLATYGSYRAYRVQHIDFDATPLLTSINRKDGDIIKTISIQDYYKIQYNINIRDSKQPLIIPESKRRKKNMLPGEKEGEIINLNKSEEQTIFLVPELIYLTGNMADNDSKDRRRNIISKTKLDPNKKMQEIHGINKLINNSNSCKSFIGKDGTKHYSKTPAEIAKEWGIMLGDNLSIEGRIIPQPVLIYGRDQRITPNNGIFRSGQIKKGVSLNNDNLVYIYDKKDNSDVVSYIKGLLDKGRNKGLKIDVNPNNLNKIALNNFNNWNDIYKQFDKIISHSKEIQMIIVFLSKNLEHYYSDLKSFFTNEIKVATQFVVSKKLQDPKRAGSIMFNIVEQINMKMGGTNYYIDLYKENILIKNKIYLVLGLESRHSHQGIDYVMTSSTNQFLNRIITSFKSVKNVKEEKEKAIEHLMELSFKELQKTAPRPPDYIILYRQGGNYVQNKKLAEEEIPFFTKYLRNRFKKYNPKFIYICCNLKGNLKFFEKKNNSIYANPSSGLCVDSNVTQKDKYEFYIQPQFVNQGTATPCHYQVLYDETEEEVPENKITIEQLQLLSFHLSFYYWTWSGAVRVPGTLKLATTAMDFFTKHLKGKFEHENKQFINPEYI